MEFPLWQRGQRMHITLYCNQRTYTHIDISWLDLLLKELKCNWFDVIAHVVRPCFESELITFLIN